MKIERDKVYLTRCGEKVRVVCVDAPEPHVLVVLDADGLCYRITPDGRFHANGESANDLVSEYVEPPKPREVWVRLSVIDGVAECAWGESEIGRVRATEPDLFAKLVKFREVIE